METQTLQSDERAFNAAARGKIHFRIKCFTANTHFYVLYLWTSLSLVAVDAEGFYNIEAFLKGASFVKH